MIPVQRDLVQAREVLQRWMEIAYPAGQSLRVGDLQGFPQGFSAELLTFDLTYEKDGAERTEGMVVRIEPNEKYQLFLDTNFEEQYRVMEALGRHTATPVPRTVGFESNREFLGARFYVMEKACGETGQIGLEWVSAIGEEGREMLWWNGLAAMAEMHRADPERLRLDFLEQPERGSDPIDQQLHYYWEYYNWVRGGESYPIIEVASSGCSGASRWCFHRKGLSGVTPGGAISCLPAISLAARFSISSRSVWALPRWIWRGGWKGNIKRPSGWG